MTSLPDGKAHQQILGSTDFGCANKSRRKKENMAYTIFFNGTKSETELKVFRENFLELLKEERRFRVGQIDLCAKVVGCGKVREAKRYLELRLIRLTEKKEYNGYQPDGGLRRAQNSTRMEWEDWVSFHSFVNDFIDRTGNNCDVWTTPWAFLDKGKRMWIRRDNKRRVSYDYEYRRGDYHMQTVWNHGTPDQFQTYEVAA
jgi:hypothetical protein